MKKQLVASLAAAMVLGVAGTSFAAANPFTDVPAKHWAYASVMSLAQAGIVDGYGDGTFKGDKMISRYEMAQIVGKAMAKSDKADAKQKAELEKLAAEFAEELNTMGVRVSKLEKNASTIKFTGDARFRYTNNYNGNATSAANDADRTQTRIRVKGEADVADNVSVTFRIAGQNRIADNGAAVSTKVIAPADIVDGTGKILVKKGDTISTITQVNKDQNDQLEFDLGFFTFKNVFGSNLSLGRTYLLLGQGLVSDAPFYDAVRFSGGNKVKFDIGYGDNKYSPGPSTNNTANTGSDNRAIKTLNLSYDASPAINVTAAALYSATASYPYEVQAFGAKAKLSPEFTLIGEYAENKSDKVTTQKKAGWTKLMYKGAKKSEVNSYGLYVDYRKVGANVIDGYTTLNNANYGQGGLKGVGYGLNYTVAKNSVFSLEIEPLKSFDGLTKFSTFTNARLEWSF